MLFCEAIRWIRLGRVLLLKGLFYVEGNPAARKEYLALLFTEDG